MIIKCSERGLVKRNDFRVPPAINKRVALPRNRFWDELLWAFFKILFETRWPKVTALDSGS